MNATQADRISHKGRLAAALQVWTARPVRILVTPVVFVVLWHLAATALSDATVLPLPLSVARALLGSVQSGQVWGHVLATLKRIGTAYAISAVAGISLGSLMGLFPSLDDVFDPILQVLRPIPGLAMLPLLLILVGIGDKLIVSVVVYGSFFPILVSTFGAVRGVDRLYEQVALTLGLDRWAILREVIIPAALPGILTGMRVGMTFAWMSIIGAEYIGTNRGLGYLLTFYQRMFVVDKVVMAMLIVGLIGFLLDRVLRAVTRLLLPWYVETGIQAT